jgi:hypothetical protein
LEEAGQAVTGFDKDRFVQNVQSGNYAGATVNVASPILQALLLTKGGEKAGVLPDGMAAPEQIGSRNVEGLASVLPRSQKLNNYELAANALPDLRKATAELGGLKEATRAVAEANPNLPKSTAQVNVAGQILGKALENVQAESSAVIQPYRGEMVSTQPIKTALQQLKDSLPANRLEERALIDEKIAKFQDNMPIGELDKERVLLNKELNGFFQRTKEGQIASPVATQADKVSRREIANVIYDNVEQLSGKDLRGLKQREHGLISIQDRLSKGANTALAKQAQAGKGQNAFMQTVSKVRGRGVQAIERNSLIERLIGVEPAEEFGTGIKTAVGNVRPRR